MCYFWIAQSPQVVKCSMWAWPGMVMDMEVQEYKVVVAGRSSPSGKNLITEVYSSQSKAWKDVDPHPVQHLYQTSAISCNGFLYSAGVHLR